MSEHGLTAGFSRKELDLLANGDILLQKRRVLKKVFDLLSQTGRRLEEVTASFNKFSYRHLVQISPKVSRGENYKGLPYLVLDYPRHFTAEDTLSFRVVFWWGNYCSISLHLHGVPLKALLLEKNLTSLRTSDADLYLCINESPWEHHFEDSNYIPLHSISNSEVLEYTSALGFLKVAQKVEFADLTNLETISVKFYKFLMSLMANSE